MASITYYPPVRCFDSTFALIPVATTATHHSLNEPKNIKFILCKINAHSLGAGIETIHPTNGYIYYMVHTYSVSVGHDAASEQDQEKDSVRILRLISFSHLRFTHKYNARSLPSNMEFVLYACARERKRERESIV